MDQIHSSTIAQGATEPSAGPLRIQHGRMDIVDAVKIRMAEAVARQDPLEAGPLKHAQARAGGLMNALFALMADSPESFDEHLLQMAEIGRRANGTLAPEDLSLLATMAAAEISEHPLVGG